MLDDFDFDRVLRCLLEPEEGSLLQVVYLKTEDGTLYPCISTPMPDATWQKVSGVVRGELIGIDFEEPDADDDEWAEADPFSRITTHGPTH